MKKGQLERQSSLAWQRQLASKLYSNEGSWASKVSEAVQNLLGKQASYI